MRIFTVTMANQRPRRSTSSNGKANGAFNCSGLSKRISREEKRLPKPAWSRLLLFAVVVSFLNSENVARIQAPTAANRNRNLQMERTALDDILRLRLESASFPDPERQNGYRYRDTVYPANPYYVDSSVGVLVPPEFRSAGPVNLVCFFRG